MELELYRIAPSTATLSCNFIYPALRLCAIPEQPKAIDARGNPSDGGLRQPRFSTRRQVLLNKAIWQGAPRQYFSTIRLSSAKCLQSEVNCAPTVAVLSPGSTVFRQPTKKGREPKFASLRRATGCLHLALGYILSPSPAATVSNTAGEAWLGILLLRLSAAAASGHRESDRAIRCSPAQESQL